MDRLLPLATKKPKMVTNRMVNKIGDLELYRVMIFIKDFIKRETKHEQDLTDLFN